MRKNSEGTYKIYYTVLIRLAHDTKHLILNFFYPILILLPKLFRDECVNFPIQKGLDASRSKVKFFHHNDCDHLEQLLVQQANEDKKVEIMFQLTKQGSTYPNKL